MKYIYSIAIMVFVVFSSCRKVMDTTPLNTYTAADIWGNYDLAEGYLYTCYAGVVGSYLAGSWNNDILTKDMLNEPWGGAYESEKTEQMDKYTDEGWNNFSKIRSVNLALQNLKEAPFTALQKNTLMGEAYFLRSILYFTEAKRFGGVQLVANVLTADSNFAIARSSIKDTYDFILRDLDSAAALLPVTNDRGRATKGAAYALTMRAALQAGAYVNDKSYYRKVITIGNALFALGLYSLDNYSNLFTSYSTAIASKENILVYEQLSTNTQFQNTPMQSLVPNADNTAAKMTTLGAALHPLAETFEGWMNYSPTQDLVDDYLVTDADGKEKVWNQTSYINTQANVNTRIYQHRDLRFYASIIYDSVKYFNNMVFTRANGNGSNSLYPLYGGVISGGGGCASSTGYLFAKYVYQAKKLWYSDPTDYCYSILRLGEAYLNYAEAAFLLGDESTARTYLTKTYQGHGGFSNVIMATGDDLWAAYKRERNVEMILENGDRYWSLLRWGMQKTGGLVTGYENSGYVIPELNGQLHGIAIDNAGLSYQVFARNEENGLPLKFTPKRYLFPVPYPTTQANPLLTENAGWQ